MCQLIDALGVREWRGEGCEDSLDALSGFSSSTYCEGQMRRFFGGWLNFGDGNVNVWSSRKNGVHIVDCIESEWEWDQSNLYSRTRVSLIYH